MPPIPAGKMTDQQKKAIEEFRVARKTEPSGPFIPMLRSPELMSPAQAMGNYLRYNSALLPRLREFVILMTARQWTQQYEWRVHYPEAINAGVNAEIVNAIAEGRHPDGMQEDEEVLYNFFTELQHNHSVSDATYARALSKFGEQGIIDIIGTVGYYTLLAMVLNTARTPVMEEV